MIRKIALGSFVLIWLVAPAIYAVANAADKPETMAVKVSGEKIVDEASKVDGLILKIAMAVEANNAQISQLQAQNAALTQRSIALRGAAEMAALLLKPEEPKVEEPKKK